jgi:hypothetical protein
MENKLNFVQYRKGQPKASDDDSSTDSDGDSDFTDNESDIEDADIDDFSQSPPKRQNTGRSDPKAMALQLNLAQLHDPQSYAEAMRAPDSDMFKAAMIKEQESLKHNSVYDIVKLPEGQRAITGRWVYKRKIDQHGKIKVYKARLVARGFQQREGIDYVETFAAVVKPASYRIFFALAAQFGYKVHQMDVKTAFLNGKLENVVYMKPPPGLKVSKGHVLKLLRSLYGLNQAPRAWYEKFCTTMEKKGWRVSPYDPCVFIHDTIRLLLCLWVDDILIAGKNDKDIAECKQQLSDSFDMTDEGECSYYLGMHVEQSESCITVHQEQYVNQMLQRYGLNDIPVTRTPLPKDVKLRKETTTLADPEFKTQYQSKVGSLNFLSNGTRLDISFAVGYMARFCSNPTQAHMDAVDHIFAYVAGTRKKGLRYTKQTGAAVNLCLTKAGITGFVDSDFANCEDSRKSTTGYVFLMSGAPISWSSKRQSIVAQSTMDAEYIAAAEAARDAVWIRNFINDLKLLNVSIGSIVLHIDNNCALRLTRNPEYHARSKHIGVKYHFVRDAVMKTKEIDTRRVDTKDNLADILTKSLAAPVHGLLRDRMGVL